MMAETDVQAELERLRAENAALKGHAAKGLRLKVSEKGAVSVYGLGRFPLTLYKEQWEKVLDLSEDITVRRASPCVACPATKCGSVR